VLIRKRSSGDGLVLLRGLLLTFSIAILLVGLVVVVLETSAEPFGSVPELPAALCLMGAGAVTLVLPPYLVRPLPCDSESELSKGYVQRFFLRIAFAESAALLAFVVFIVTGAGWLYLVGAGFTAVGFVRLAPTATHLAKEQDELRRAGCTRSLVAALRQHPLGRP
jgi:disulfide bond formation protein DsbB